MIAKLPTDFVDEVTSQYKYKIADLDKGLSEVENVTEFSVKGSYYGATELKATSKKANEVIDKSAEHEEILNRIINDKNGQFRIISEKSDNSLDAILLSVPRKINGVEFDNSKNITVYDNTKVNANDNAIIRAMGLLTFNDKVLKITDSRIHSYSLAKVIVRSDCLDEAERCALEVDTYNGYLEIRLGRTPQKSIYAGVSVRS